MDDSIDARIPPSCPANISQILYHAWHHDLAGLKPLLNVPGRASVQEPKTGETPLHAAIRACGPASAEEGSGHEVDLEAAKAVVHELFLSGAIWNDIDSNNETPGCLALRLGQSALYQLCVDAGMRAELLFGLMDGYEQLESEEEEEEEEEEAQNGNGDADMEDPEEAPDLVLESDPDRAFKLPQPAEPNDKDGAYLRSTVTYSDGKLVDSSQNAVMMAWETSIMRASVDSMLPDLPRGRRVLNIGFGMGIIDTMIAETSPTLHHIIEAHPEVQKHVKSPESKFGEDWEKSGPQEGAYKVFEGKWQDIVPKLLEKGDLYDAIYFDTFGEDYSQLRMFFTEYVPGLMDEQGIFGFFNGLGADRKICYDVYQKVVEMHLTDAGLDVEWVEMPVDLKGLEEAGKGEWEGVKRRYWTLDTYRLPKCTFMG